ncbi:MAG: N-acetylglucosamine kinase [Bacteroidetes bacterium]|nr:N-acetylglucosamine kinase [Bacteroidota bacterium]
MATVKLVADSGATKTAWCLLEGSKKRKILTAGISPYFLNTAEIVTVLQQELLPKLKKVTIQEIFYYGTGCANPANAKIVYKALALLFPAARIEVRHDLMGAARALCGSEKGIVCILGTGSNSCFYNGKKITRNSPGLGYVLGDEGSGAYLGKRVIQYYLYGTFDEELRGRFELRFTTTPAEILENVYKKSLPNRYLASFTSFLAENRGHYMIENILEDGLNDFFFQHLCRYPEVWKFPLHFTGGISYAFKDVIKQLCYHYEFELGSILPNPTQGLITFHSP